MIKNKFKKLSILVYSLLLVGVCSGVRAADPTERRLTRLTTEQNIAVNGVHSAGKFYEFDLDGSLALCLNAGKGLSMNNVFVLKSSQPITDPNIIKAYEYANVDRLAAQVVVWSVMQGNSNFALNISQAKKISLDDAIVIWNQIRSKPGTTALYEWEVKSGSEDYQDLITTAPGTPIDNKCKIETYSSPAVCVGGNKSNTGLIYQRAVGNCPDTYTSDLKTNYSGDYLEGVSGYCKLYCKDSLVQEYPGNIAVPVPAGRYIVWPNNEEEEKNIYKKRTKLNIYPLKVTYEKTCKMYFNHTKTSYSSVGVVQMYEGMYKELDGYKNTYPNVITDDTDCATITTKYNDANNYYNSLPDEKYDPKTKKNITNKDKSAAWDVMDGLGKLKDACNNFLNTYNNKVIPLRDSINSCVNYGTKNLKVDVKFGFNVNRTTINTLLVDEYEPNNNYKTTKTKEIENSESKSISGVSLLTIPSSKNILKDLDLEKFKSKTKDIKDGIEKNVIYEKIINAYDLDDGRYYYVDLLNNKSVDIISDNIKNYSYIGFSNLPVSSKAILGRPDSNNYYYQLKLDVTEAKGISAGIKKVLDVQNYTCHYEVTKSNNSCICPPGTKHAGESLDCLIKEQIEKYKVPYTCADGQEIWCDADLINTEQKCDLTCPSPNEHISLEACINLGNSYEYCESKYCKENYKCPEDSPTNPNMDITGCVISVMEKNGLGRDEAIKYCKNIVCPGNGLKIIYRTIKLENPFPSYNADTTAIGKDLKMGMFNTTVKGRYPGSNWNSEKLVKAKIINNRETSGTTIYQTKEPLYVFELTPARIKAIREYNDKNKYDDFNLRCYNAEGKSSGIACRSNFVHAIEYGLTSGTCQNVSNNLKDFYNCVN